jgi:hypothetical protein
MVLEPLIYGFLPFDPVLEVVFFMFIFIFVVLLVVEVILGIVRRRRFGYVFPPQVLGIKLNPSQTAAVVELVPTKDTVETKDQSQIFHAHERTIYTEAKTGVKFTIIEPISDFAQNIQLVQYIMHLKNGLNLLGPKNGDKGTPLQFSSLNEARLYFYEEIYLKDKTIGADQKWIDKEMEKVRQAKGLIDITKNTKTDGVETVSEGPKLTTSQIRETTEEPIGPMSPAAFDDFMFSIQERVIQYGADVYPISIDGETVTFNALEKWMASPSPENTLDEQFQKGYRKGQNDYRRSSTDLLKVAFAFLIIALAAAFLFTKI